MGFLLINSNISLLFWSKEFAILVKTCHQVANSLFYGSTFLFFLGEIECSLMSYANQAFTILWNTVVHGV